jgi:hypothetical protein
MQDQKTIDDFIEILNEHPNPKETLFNNWCYANPSSKHNPPILKADLVRLYAEKLLESNIQRFQDLANYQNRPALEQQLRRLPASSSGIIVSYFMMLAGDENQVKPDRMILRFINDCIGRHVSADEAGCLLQGSCKILAKALPTITPRSLDHAIWTYQRKK